MDYAKDVAYANQATGAALNVKTSQIDSLVDTLLSHGRRLEHAMYQIGAGLDRLGGSTPTASEPQRPMGDPHCALAKLELIAAFAERMANIAVDHAQRFNRYV